MDGIGNISFAWLFGLIFLTIVIGIFIMNINKADSGDDRQDHEDSAIDILKKRLARGEISPEEYNKIKRDII
jgi:putative membrane protein